MLKNLLIVAKTMMETVDSNSIIWKLNFVLQNMFQTPEQTLNFKLLITDKASYCLSVRKNFKILYMEMIHVTCLCRGLHNYTEFIWEKCPTINSFITSFKKLLSVILKIKNTINLTSFLIFPILTRWGTWLTSAKWVHQSLIYIEPFLKTRVAKKINL